MQTVPNNGVFDATQYDPNQGGSKHPVGMYPFVITNTQIVSSKDEKSGMFRVTFESPAGVIDRNYNLWFPDNKQVEEIAHGQLSALCYATGVYKINMAAQGRELVGAKGTMEIGWQKNQEPGSEKGGPNGGYVEIKKVFDSAGNEPGKNKPAPQPQQQQGWNNNQPQNNQPMQQDQNGGWSNPNQQQNNNQAQGGWNNNQQQQAQPQQQEGGRPNWGGGNQGGQVQTPPWGQK